MLKKLFEYEWKDSWKIVGGMNLAVLLLSVLSRLFYRESFLDIIDNNEYMMIVFVLYNILYFAVIIALALITQYYFYYRFYKNLYTDEGYLMHTLPVTAHELIWAKTFTAILWQIIGGVVLMLSFGNFVDIMMRMDGSNIWVLLRQMNSSLWEALASLEATAPIICIAILFVLLIIVAPFFRLYFGYLAISLGQLTKKHKLLAAVGIFFGLSYGLQLVFSLFTVPIARFAERLDELSVNAGLWAVALMVAVLVLVFAALSVGCYYLTHFVMTKKLNLE
ncbi:MAG: hypothetical protein J6P60_04070 [Lachnospiraceae bacterium]|nr:hypothetical protein [Lachnospiraceae bacterium]